MTLITATAPLEGEDLPESTGYRGRHMIALPVEDEAAWLRYYGLSYWMAPDKNPDAPQVCTITLISDNPEIELTCSALAGSGARIPLPPVGDRPPAKSFQLVLRSGGAMGEDPATWPVAVPGTSVTFRVNYTDSRHVKDVVIPLEFAQPVTDVLGGRHLFFRLSEQPVTSTALRAASLDRPAGATPLIYLHGYEDPDTGAETMGTRLPPFALTRERISTAWQAVLNTGHFDPAVFPNIANETDEATRAAVTRAVAGLDEAAVAQQLAAGARLVVLRDGTGAVTYRFVPAPEHCRPGLVLVEHYRLTSFPARYGPGRTIKTFSLLPGERTSIRISTYKRSTESTQQTSSILDATSKESESEFGRTVNSEQSNQANASKTFEYRAEAEAQGQANWGWGSASARVSGGVSGSSNSAREELSKNITNAVNQNTARASVKREVQIDTSMDVKLEFGEEQAVERVLENINVSRTLNFTFRQMNQEYVTLLHLVDLRVAFFNGHAESRDEVPLSGLDRLLQDCLNPEYIPRVREQVLAAVRGLTDHEGRARPEILREVDGGYQIDTGLTSDYEAPDGRRHTVPGIIIGADQHVLRTDGVVVDAQLGEGDALDEYSMGLQRQAVAAEDAVNDRRRAETERLRLAMRLVEQGDAAAVALYQKLFPVQQVVNQIDHAAVSTTVPAVPDEQGERGEQANGRQPTGATS